MAITLANLCRLDFLLLLRDLSLGSIDGRPNDGSVSRCLILFVVVLVVLVLSHEQRETGGGGGAGRC